MASPTDTQELIGYIVQARELLMPYKAHPRAGEFVTILNRVHTYYLTDAASPDLDVTQQNLEEIRRCVGLANDAYYGGDRDGLFKHTDAMISALPGDPTTGPRPPWKR